MTSCRSVGFEFRSLLFSALCASLLMSVSLLMSSAARADTAIWVVDMQRVLDQSIAGKAVRSTMEAEAKKREAKLGVVRNELDRARADLEKQSGVLSAQARDARREDLAKRERELARQVQDAQEELTRQSQGQMARVISDIRKIVSEISTKEGKEIVIEKDPRVVMYVRDGFDITDSIIKTFDERKIN